MKISRQELERLIKEELLEALEQYPADAMAEITATIFSLADQAGVETTGDQREEIVGEIEKLLRGQGFELREQGLTFAEPLHLDLGGTQLGDLMLDIRDALPGAWNQMIKAFERGGINTGLSPESEESEGDEIPSILTVADPEEDDGEDLTSTVTTPPVSPPDDEDEEDQTDTVIAPPVSTPPEDDEGDENEGAEEEPEEEEPPLKVGDIVRVKENDISGIEPGDYEVADIYAGTPGNDALNSVLLTAVDGEGGYRDRLSLILDNPDVFKINPLLPKIKNPWAFKWFWEEEDEEESPGWMKKAAKGIRGVLGGSNTSLKVLGGLTGVAGIVGLMKYLAKDEEKVNEASALQKGEDLKFIGENFGSGHWAFVPEILKFVLSLTLDKEQMATVETVEEVIRLAGAFVHSDDLKQQKEIDAAIYRVLDEVPGIEWVDKLPGGRERIVEIMRERWDEMSTKEKISFIVALLPQDVVERLDALIPGPDLSEMDMRWPEAAEELGGWFDYRGGIGTGRGWAEEINLPAMLFTGANMFGLMEWDQFQSALDILIYTDQVLADAKDDSNTERMMKVMNALFEHKKQLNRMKVLAGVK